MRLIFLGCASCYPTQYRAVSCTALQFEDGNIWLFDCGEASQIQVQKSSVRIGKISKIFITHLHGDHLFGLPGMICTMGMQLPQKKELLLEIFGPCGIRRYIRESLNLSRSPLPFQYKVNELVPVGDQYPDDWEEWKVPEQSDGPLHPQEVEGTQIHSEEGVWQVFTDKNVIVKAGALKHRIPCFGYVIEETRIPGKLNTQKLLEKGVKPSPLYRELKEGNSITTEKGDIIHPDEVLGPSRPGRKVTILGDTCDSSGIREIARGSDLLVHEATLENSLREQAVEFGHSTPSMAAEFAMSIEARSLILFHFSQRYRTFNWNLEKEECSVHQLIEEAKSKLNNESSIDCSVVGAFDLMDYEVPRRKLESSKE